MMDRSFLPAAALILSLAVCASGCESSSRDRATGAAAREPAPVDVERMHRAASVGKIGVPVEVRYLWSETPRESRPATLQLAVIPRVSGSRMQVEFPQSAALTVDAAGADLAIGKAEAAGVYRRSVLVTAHEPTVTEVRAIVSMDVDGGRYFSVFTIPIERAAAPSGEEAAERTAPPAPGAIGGS